MTWFHAAFSFCVWHAGDLGCTRNKRGGRRKRRKVVSRSLGFRQTRTGGLFIFGPDGALCCGGLRILRVASEA